MPQTAHLVIPRPADDEYLPYYGKYISKVAGDDALAAIVRQSEETAALLHRVDEERSTFRYAEGKWSVKQVIGHVADGERVFAYRALRFARRDTTPLPGFEENDYAANGGFDERPFSDIALEFRAVRAASIALFAGLSPDALLRRGKANDAVVSVRALAWIIAGHEVHHRTLLLERYGLE